MTLTWRLSQACCVLALIQTCSFGQSSPYYTRERPFAHQPVPTQNYDVKVWKSDGLISPAFGQRVEIGHRLWDGNEGYDDAHNVAIELNDPVLGCDRPLIARSRYSLWDLVSFVSNPRQPLQDGRSLVTDNQSPCNGDWPYPITRHADLKMFVRARDDGFDVEYEFSLPDDAGPTEKFLIGNMTLGGLNFGRVRGPMQNQEVVTRLFSFDGQEVVVKSRRGIGPPGVPTEVGELGYASLGSYPQDWYSPLAVLRGEDYTIGVSLQYDIRKYKHNMYLELLSTTMPGNYPNWCGNNVDAAASRTWSLHMTPEAHVAREQPDNSDDAQATIWGDELMMGPKNTPDEKRLYVLSVRVLRHPTSLPMAAQNPELNPGNSLTIQEWMWTLSPYATFFKSMTSGSPRHIKNPEPVFYRLLAQTEKRNSCFQANGFNYSTVTSQGWGTATTSGTILRDLDQDYQRGWRREMLWNAGGIMPSYEPVGFDPDGSHPVGNCGVSGQEAGWGWCSSAPCSCTFADCRCDINTLWGQLLGRPVDGDYNFPSFLTTQWSQVSTVAPAMQTTLPNVDAFLSDHADMRLGLWWGFSSRPMTGWRTQGFHTYRTANPADEAWQSEQLAVCFNGAQVRFNEVGLDTYSSMPTWDGFWRLVGLVENDPEYGNLRYVTESRVGDILHLLAPTYLDTNKAFGYLGQPDPPPTPLGFPLATPHYLANLLHVHWLPNHQPGQDPWGADHETWARIKYEQCQEDFGCMNEKANAWMKLGYVPLIPAVGIPPPSRSQIINPNSVSVDSSIATVPPPLHAVIASSPAWFYPDVASYHYPGSTASSLVIDRSVNWNFHIRTDTWGRAVSGRNLVSLDTPLSSNNYRIRWQVRTPSQPTNQWTDVSEFGSCLFDVDAADLGRTIHLYNPSNSEVLDVRHSSNLYLTAVVECLNPETGLQENYRSSSFAMVFEGACGDIDFNNDGLFPETTDIDDLLSVFSGGPCSSPECCDSAECCDSIDFNGDGLYPDTADIDSFLSVFSGGPCL